MSGPSSVAMMVSRHLGVACEHPGFIGLLDIYDGTFSRCFARVIFFVNARV